MSPAVGWVMLVTGLAAVLLIATLHLVVPKEPPE